MGQQQLLLLTLGIVIVGTAVVAGIEAFDVNRKRAAEDAERLKMVEMAAMVQAWKMTPRMLGGGLEYGRSDFTNFDLGILGLAQTSGPNGTPIVAIPGAGCFRFFPSSTDLQINSLNEECVIGSWTKGLVVSGPRPEDMSWIYP